MFTIFEKNSNKKSKVIIKFKYNQFQNFERYIFNILSKSYFINNKIFKKAVIYKIFIKKFNIYIDLHFNEIIFEYIILNNVITISNKNKY